MKIHVTVQLDDSEDRTYGKTVQIPAIDSYDHPRAAFQLHLMTAAKELATRVADEEGLTE